MNAPACQPMSTSQCSPSTAIWRTLRPDQAPECQIVVRGHKRIPAPPFARPDRGAYRDLAQSLGNRIEHRLRCGQWACASVCRPPRGLSRGPVSPNVSISTIQGNLALIGIDVISREIRDAVEPARIVCTTQDLDFELERLTRRNPQSDKLIGCTGSKLESPTTMMRNCPKCGTDNFHRPLLKYSWRDWALKQCTRCRFVYLENPPSYERLAAEHPWEKNSRERRERMRAEYPLTFATSRGWGALRRRLVKKPDKLMRLIDRWFPPGPVADIGCGDGGSLARLPGRFEPVGIELSEQLARRSQERLAHRDVTILNMPALEGLRNIPDDTLSGIIMCSFLEHEERPGRSSGRSSAHAWKGWMRHHQGTELRLLQPSCVGLSLVRLPFSRPCQLLFTGKLDRNSRMCGFARNAL